MWSFTAYQWDTEEEGYMQVGRAFCSSLERGLFYSIWEETCIGKRWKVLFTTASPNTLLIPEGCIQDGMGVAFYSSRRLVRDLWHWKMNSELKPMRSNVLSLLFLTKSPLLHPAQLTKWCLMTSSQFFEEKRYKRQPLSAIAPFGFTSKTPMCCMHKLWYCISWNITGQPSTQSWLHQTAAVVLLYAASWLLQGQNHFFSGQKEPSLLPQGHKPLRWDGREGSPNSLSYFSVSARAVAKLTWLAGAGCLSPSSDGAWLALSHGSSQSRDEWRIWAEPWYDAHKLPSSLDPQTSLDTF